MRPMRMGARVVVLGMATCLASVTLACNGEDGYRVLVRWEDDAVAMRSDRIELALLDSCDVVAPGQPPPEQARRLEVVRGEPPAAFGEVSPGRAGLYGRAFDEEACGVIAASCAPVVLEEGGGGTLEIVLGAITEQSCPGGTVCQDGNCVTEMMMPGGEAWIAAPCFDEGRRCGDSLTGVVGTCHDTPTGVRCCAGCYESSGDRCEPGDTQEHCGWGGEDCDDCFGGDTCQGFDIIRQCQ